MVRTTEQTDFLASILVTAVEGGINYWAETRSYNFVEKDRNFTAAFAEVRELPTGNWRPLTLDVVAEGVRLIKLGGVRVNRSILYGVLAGALEYDASEIDAEAADVIVQAGLFGQIVYG